MEMNIHNIEHLRLPLLGVGHLAWPLPQMHRWKKMIQRDLMSVEKIFTLIPLDPEWVGYCLKFKENYQTTVAS